MPAPTRVGRALRALSVWAAAAVLMIGPMLPRAAAQDDGSEFLQRVKKSDTALYTTRLRLSTDQQMAMDALFDAYQAECRAAYARLMETVNAYEEKVKAAKESERDEVRRVLMHKHLVPLVYEAFEERDSLEHTFLDDLQSMLLPEQAEQWSAVERARRRTRELANGQRAGEAVDLVEIVEQLALADGVLAAVRPELDRYEAELDRVLVDRQRFEETNFAKRIELGTRSSPSPDKIAELDEQQQEISRRVLEVNEKFIRTIEPLLPTEKKNAFDELVKKKTFPRIYAEPSWAMHQIDVALGLDDLSATQRVAVEGLKESVQRELGAINARMEDVLRKQEERQLNQAGDGGMSFGGGNNEPNFEALLQERQQIELRFDPKLRSLLSLEQAEKIPAKPEEPKDGVKKP